MEKLDISFNKSLLSIPSGVFKLSKLLDVKCNGCQSMTSPPHAVSKQGLAAMRKYFGDLEEGGKRNLKPIPVTVVG